MRLLPLNLRPWLLLCFSAIAMPGSRAIAGDAVLASKEIVISGAPRQQMAYGMDFERLWYWKNLKDKKKLMQLAFKECRVQYVRVGISCGAELQQGVRHEEAYEEDLDIMRRIVEARPDIEFFASPQPLKVALKGKDVPWTCYPKWMHSFDKKGRIVDFKHEEAADYLIKYLRFMKKKGFRIKYMDVKNEVDRIAPQPVARMIEKMRRELGDEMPVVLAPSSHNAKGGARWLEKAREAGLDFFDIASVHNTGDVLPDKHGYPVDAEKQMAKWGTPEVFASAAVKFGKKPLWNTELHLFWGPDEVAPLNSSYLWKYVRAGFSGMNQWLSLGNEKKTHKMFRTMSDGSLEVMRTYYIYKKLVNTSGGGRYHASNVPRKLGSTVAFVKKDLLTVWVLNSQRDSAVSTILNLKAFELKDGPVVVTSWEPGNRREGEQATVSSESIRNAKLTATVPARSLHCYEIPLK